MPVGGDLGQDVMAQRDAQSSPAQPARFIVGMPRAATTWLCKCFNERPDTAAFGESMFFGRRYVEPQAGGGYSDQQVQMLLTRYSEGACLQSVRGDGPGALKRVSRDNLAQVLERAFTNLPDTPTPAQAYQCIADAIAHAEGKSVAVEKTPHHLNWLDRIFEAFPEARIVVLLREPYAFMLSYKHQGDRKATDHRKRLERLYHPMACALIWRASMRSALAAQAHHGEQILFVEHERIKSDANAVLDEVQRFFQFEPMDLASRVPPDNTSFPNQKRPELKPADVFWMNLICGRVMARAGYVRRRVPFDPLGIAWSILRLPLWGIGCLLTLRRIVDGSLTTYIMRWFRPQPPRASQASTTK